ncbi:hypothetical protein ACQXVK_00325 [Curtobacterium sp. AB451]|uniref:hypothetical protein n=1 Tax=unclassified Curtobacterium TaxID=257496 RepID=UPI0011D19CCB|nr:hypothetical protein [Curtobacterium sp. B18]
MPEHPALVRLRAELDAAWKGIGALGDMEDVSRDRVVAELRAAVPDVASLAARAAGADLVVAEICRFAEAEVVATDSTVPTATIWDDIVHSAAEAASAAR